MENEDIVNLGSGSLFIGELEQVDLSGLEQLIAGIEAVHEDFNATPSYVERFADGREEA